MLRDDQIRWWEGANAYCIHDPKADQNETIMTEGDDHMPVCNGFIHKAHWVGGQLTCNAILEQSIDPLLQTTTKAADDKNRTLVGNISKNTVFSSQVREQAGSTQRLRS